MCLLICLQLFSSFCSAPDYLETCSDACVIDMLRITCPSMYNSEASRHMISVQNVTTQVIETLTSMGSTSTLPALRQHCHSNVLVNMWPLHLCQLSSLALSGTAPVPVYEINQRAATSRCSHASQCWHPRFCETQYTLHRSS